MGSSWPTTFIKLFSENSDTSFVWKTYEKCFWKTLANILNCLFLISISFYLCTLLCIHIDTYVLYVYVSVRLRCEKRYARGVPLIRIHCTGGPSWPTQAHPNANWLKFAFNNLFMGSTQIGRGWGRATAAEAMPADKNVDAGQ